MLKTFPLNETKLRLAKDIVDQHGGYLEGVAKLVQQRAYNQMPRDLLILCPPWKCKKTLQVQTITHVTYLRKKLEKFLNEPGKISHEKKNTLKNLSQGNKESSKIHRRRGNKTKNKTKSKTKKIRTYSFQNPVSKSVCVWSLTLTKSCPWNNLHGLNKLLADIRAYW